jgi:hypothetical protein
MGCDALSRLLHVSCHAAQQAGVVAQARLARAMSDTPMALCTLSCLDQAKFYIPRVDPFDQAQKYRTNW